MTEDDALALVAEREGRLCVRFYQRHDGTVLTSDCLVGAEEEGAELMVGGIDKYFP